MFQTVSVYSFIYFLYLVNTRNCIYICILALSKHVVKEVPCQTSTFETVSWNRIVLCFPVCFITTFYIYTLARCLFSPFYLLQLSKLDFWPEFLDFQVVFVVSPLLFKFCQNVQTYSLLLWDIFTKGTLICFSIIFIVSFTFHCMHLCPSFVTTLPPSYFYSIMQM